MEKIKRLKKILINEKLDGYIIPKNDEFFSEYTPSHNDRLKYISSFNGSYGFALILKNKNYLFVDGRYTLQATRQSGKIFKIITIPNKMPYNILGNKELTIGFDPKLFTKKILNTIFIRTKCKFKPIEKNLIDKIWIRKIEKNRNNFYRMPNNSVGINYRKKINKVISYIKKIKADFLFITASENNAWLLNIRGRDIEHAPIPHCYILIDRNKNIDLFCDTNKISYPLKNYFKKIKFLNFKSIDDILLSIRNKKFIIDTNTCSIYFQNIIVKNNSILKSSDPVYNLKAVKTKKEINNMREAHVYDGAALTRYLFWLKKNYEKKRITEISGSQKLYEFRKKNDKFKFLSFPTISGTGPNGAIIHYKATKKTNRKLKKGEVYLVDSGGQYKFGTTDVTRTISLQNSSKRVKNIFTRVLKGHIAVSNFKIKDSTSGSQIDFEARKYLKKIGLDYSHGTGHGVGYFLNVHEGPQAISKNNKVKLKEGMILSNEPGYYETNKFGIRIENLLYVKKEKNKSIFKNLTMAPIDKELINPNILNKNEKNWLNNYHKEVYYNLKKIMSKKEVIELRKACSAI